jgi:hypothetical protein
MPPLCGEALKDGKKIQRLNHATITRLIAVAQAASPLTIGTTLLIIQGVNPWLTVPLGAFAAWWTFKCTRTLWAVVSFRIEVWRLHQAPSISIEDWRAPRWQWLSNPKLDSWINVGTVIGVLCFPALLWLP